MNTRCVGGILRFSDYFKRERGKERGIYIYIYKDMEREKYTRTRRRRRIRTWWTPAAREGQIKIEI